MLTLIYPSLFDYVLAEGRQAVPWRKLHNNAELIKSWSSVVE
jgi:hypothetical protein